MSATRRFKKLVDRANYQEHNVLVVLTSETLDEYEARAREAGVRPERIGRPGTNDLKHVLAALELALDEADN